MDSILFMDGDIYTMREHPSLPWQSSVASHDFSQPPPLGLLRSAIILSLPVPVKQFRHVVYSNPQRR